MMGPGFGDGIARAAILGLAAVVAVVAGAAFGIGYGCHACDYRPHFEFRKREAPTPNPSPQSTPQPSQGDERGKR